jgi:uncharacterized protein YjaZ
MRYTVQGFTGKRYRNLVAFAQAYITLLKLEKASGNLFIVADTDPKNMGRAVDTECGEYIVFLNPKFDTTQLCQTLAHEMVHVKQYSRGQLKLKNKGVFWCGKLFPYESQVSYTERPWEIDAMKRETLLHYAAMKMVS